MYVCTMCYSVCTAAEGKVMESTAPAKVSVVSVVSMDLPPEELARLRKVFIYPVTELTNKVKKGWKVSYVLLTLFS